MRTNASVNYSLECRRYDRLIKRICADSSKIILTLHAEDRMTERGIDFQDVINVLLSGELQNIRKQNGHDVLKIVGGKFNRKIGVVSVVIRSDTVVKIITVEWEDMK